MHTEYDDYSNQIGLRIRHALGRIRYIPIRGASRIARILRSAIPKPDLVGPCIISTIHGFLILVDPVLDKGIERTLFEFGTYEEGTLQVIKQIIYDGDLFIDIGANIGLMSLFVAKLLNGTGQVLSFEPLPSTFAILEKNKRLNNFNNLKAVNSAVGCTNGSVDIYDNIDINRGSASLIRLTATEATHRIPITCLDDYIERNQYDRAKCIKIDVEGWELEVLKGANNILAGPNAPICIVECSTLHPIYGGDTQSIFDFMRSVNSYRIYHLAKGSGTPSKLVEITDKKMLPAHDNLVCLLPEHIRNLPRKIFQP